MLRALIHKTAWLMDRDGAFSVSDKVSICNYQANQLCCEAADTAMQVHGGIGYRATSRLSIFIVTTDGTELPRAQMKFRSAAWRGTYLAL